jgi:hypothetical protein
VKVRVRKNSLGWAEVLTVISCMVLAFMMIDSDWAVSHYNGEKMFDFTIESFMGVGSQSFLLY